MYPLVPIGPLCDNSKESFFYSQMNLRNTLLGLHIPIFLQGGLGTGSTVEVNSDTLRVRTKPEVRMEGPGGLYMTLGVV